MVYDEYGNGSKLSKNSTSHTDQNRQESRKQKYRADPNEVYKPLTVYHQKESATEAETADVKVSYDQGESPRQKSKSKMSNKAVRKSSKMAKELVEPCSPSNPNYRDQL